MPCVRQKYLDYAVPVIGRARAARIAQMIEDLETRSARDLLGEMAGVAVADRK